MKNFIQYLSLTLILIFISCEKADIDPQMNMGTDDTSENISTPDGFDFETERAITLVISDETPNVKYEIFGYRSYLGNEAENITNALNNILYSGKPTNGFIRHVITLSHQYDKVYISRKDGIEYSFEIKDIDNNIINFTSPLEVKSKVKPSSNVGSRTTNCGDCTQIWTNGDFEDNIGSIPAVPGSSFIQTSEENVDGWNTTSPDGLIEVWKSGFRSVASKSGDSHAELNATQPSALYQRICITPNSEFTWSIWHRGRMGVDVASVRIGTNLLTATTVQIMSTDKYGWVNYTGTYIVPDGQQDTFLIFESISTANNNLSVGNFIDNIVITETIVGDPCGGGTITYPGGLNPANLAFEDKYPVIGDYDFNDLVVSYNIEIVLNSENKVTQMDIDYNVSQFSAIYINGFGIELEGVSPSAISSVSGTNLTEGNIVTDNNGTESGQQNAVIVFFDNANNEVGIPKTISIIFTNPISTTELGNAPFNPFLIQDAHIKRKREIHLPNKPSTSLGGAIGGDDVDGNFMDINDLPWAININTSDEFIRPLPGEEIWRGYVYFIDWVNSGGVSFSDWYMDLPEYRNDAFLEPY